MRHRVQCPKKHFTVIDFFKRMEGKPDKYDRGAQTPEIYPYDETWNDECRRCTEQWKW